ncbi:MAG: hypothetical protein KAV82_12065 [Phycisphaerae bacterium]|nr:hypothetical protein [Phycisphaerae bacterium]
MSKDRSGAKTGLKGGASDAVQRSPPVVASADDSAKLVIDVHIDKPGVPRAAFYIMLIACVAGTVSVILVPGGLSGAADRARPGIYAG